ncbi:MAG TPA: LysR substrate-binding domain-containing protein [Geobacteraceae bacterium]
MDVRQLRFFTEIARLSNFTKAAEGLHVAQPAVSMAIRKLEEELELVLFNRQDKKVSLTAEGEIFLAHARRILDDIKAASQEMGELRDLGKGEVRIGIPPMMSAYFFPDIIWEFKKRYPNLSLSVTGEGAARIKKMISQGEIDMGVIAGRTISDDLEVRHFLREEVVVCVPRGHRFARRKGVTLGEFAREPLVFFKEGYYLRELMGDVLKGTGVTPAIVFETNMFTLVKSLVRAGMGISTFLRMVVAGDDELVAVPFDPPLHLDLVIAWKRHAYLSRANRAFVDFLLEQRGQAEEKPA